MALSSIAAIAGIASAGAGIYGTLSRNQQSAQQSSNINNDALRNAIYAQMNSAGLNAEALKRSTAGYTDSSGTSQAYDPYTNTWKTTLGALPQQDTNASLLASIQRNTTDMRQAQGANAQSAGRALQSSDAADSALRGLRAFNPMSANGLTGALIERATTANRNAETPLIQDTLRQYARMGTSAAPVLSQLQRQSADNLRSSIIDSTIAGYQNAGGINAQNQKNLTDRYSTTMAGAQPQFQYPGINPNNTSNALAQLTAYRAGQSGQAATYAARNPMDAANSVTGAARNAASSVPSSNFAGQQVTDLGKGVKNLTDSGIDAYQNLFGSSGQSASANKDYGNWVTSTQNDPSYKGVTW